MASLTTTGSGGAARWPQRLQALVAQLHAGGEAAGRESRGEIWLILRTVTAGYVRFHGTRRGRLSAAEVADISAQKSLDLLLRVDSHQWRPDREDPGQVRAFISTVSRNGVVDVLRRQGRTTRLPDPEELAMRNPQPNSAAGANERPTDRVEAAEFVECLHDCVGGLTPRARKLWFFRVLYEMPSKGIANHPEIRMTVGHVDVALQRCRRTISECMADKGMKLRVLPPGTFAALWELCVRDRGVLLEEESHG